MSKKKTTKQSEPVAHYTSTNIIEIYDFTENNITVRVKIDHLLNEISLIDNTHRNTSESKKWFFSQRGVEYMQGWLNILEVMQHAITDAKQRYEKQHAEINKLKEQKIERIAKLASNWKKVNLLNNE
jgi:hypothetical protein